MMDGIESFPERLEMTGLYIPKESNNEVAA